METAKPSEKLSAKQVLLRLLSVVACGMGAAACVFSLSLQIVDVGSFIASACWFVGLGTVTAGIAGYVVTCSPRHANVVALATVAIIAIGAGTFWLERAYLWAQAVILLTLVVLVVEAAALYAYHRLLKREDPRAL